MHEGVSEARALCWPIARPTSEELSPSAGCRWPWEGLQAPTVQRALEKTATRMPIQPLTIEVSAPTTNETPESQPVDQPQPEEPLAPQAMSDDMAGNDDEHDNDENRVVVALAVVLVHDGVDESTAFAEKIKQRESNRSL